MEVNATRGWAIIIGASLAGLFAATLLRKAGWRTEVFERSDVELVLPGRRHHHAPRIAAVAGAQWRGPQRSGRGRA